jgi:hypothetical protein
MNGWADLGAILTGGVKREAEQEYLPRLQKNFSTFKALEDARLVRSRNLARDNAQAAMREQGFNEIQANIPFANEVVDLGKLGDYQRRYSFDADRKAAQDLGIIENALGDIVVDKGGANNALGYIKGEPMKRSDIQDGIMFDPLGGEQAGTVTPLGDARIAEDLATAGAANALSREREARAALTDAKRTSPERYRAPPKPEGGYSTKADESAVLKSAREALIKALSIKDQEKRKATQKAIYNRLVDSGYGKIANDLMGE